VSVGLLRNAVYAISKFVTSNYMYSVKKFSRVPKVTGRVIWPTEVATTLGTIPWKGAGLGCSIDLDNSI
jgi:hypothetical protein